MTVILLGMLMLAACSKEEPFVGSPSTVQLFNALDNGTELYADLSGNRPLQFKTALMINNKQYYDVRTNSISTKQPLQPLDLWSTSDTSTHDSPLIRANLELEEKSFYSMFIFGNKTAAEFLLHKDEIPALKANDSVTFIRFANFGNAQPISVNLKGEPAGSFMQSLPYKGIGEFTEMNARTAVGQYEFEIRDQASEELLAVFIADNFGYVNGSVVINKWYNKSNTLVLTGHYNGTGPNEQKVYLMNHR
ncbi:hypothetical protein [Pseudobacter ginsenosidimutans]|nr:hypothetical protein [Pseudobacter ginsenosidimutans]